MENLNIIITYLGSNLKDLVVTIFLKFILYMSVLAILLIFFFSYAKVINSTILISVILIFPVLAHYIINRKILIKHLIMILYKYPGINNNEKAINNDVPDMENWKKVRRTILTELKKIISDYVTLEFHDSFTVLKIKTGEFPSNRVDDIRVLYKDHKRQKLLKMIANLLTALPFFSVSIFLTFGYNSPELKLISLMLAFIFYLFIKSAIINPIFYLMTYSRLFKSFIS